MANRFILCISGICQWFHPIGMELNEVLVYLNPQETL